MGDSWGQWEWPLAVFGYVRGGLQHAHHPPSKIWQTAAKEKTTLLHPGWDGVREGSLLHEEASALAFRACIQMLIFVLDLNLILQRQYSMVHFRSYQCKSLRSVYRMYTWNYFSNIVLLFIKTLQILVGGRGSIISTAVIDHSSEIRFPLLSASKGSCSVLVGKKKKRDGW